MKKFKFILTATICFTIGTNNTFGQGCSDAGFCTIDSFKPNNTHNYEVSNQLKLGAYYGLADNDINVYGNYFEYNRQLNNTIGLDAKLTTTAQNGNGRSSFGLSDFFVNANFKLNYKLILTLGTKIPLSKANKKTKNQPLPMDYQASLGTWDLIFGVGYHINDIQIVTAIQQPLTQNDNQFLATDYPAGTPLNSFQSTRKFQRSADVLLRVSYPVMINSKLKLTPSILPIYHLSNDKYTDQLNVKKEIKGSQGLTLNGNAYIDYEFNNQNTIQLNIGMPFIVRDSRPDGLTRSFIVNLEYNIKF